MNTLMFKAMFLRLICRIDRKGFGLFYESLREFRAAYADIFTFITHEYHDLETRGVPDPHFEEVVNRIYETTNSYNAVQLTTFFGSTPQITATAFAQRRVPGSWLLYLAYMEGPSPDWILKGKNPHYLQWRERGLGTGRLHCLRKNSLWWRIAEKIARGVGL